MVATGIRYAQAGPSPISYFMKIRVRQLDIINEEFVWNQEYFIHEELDNAYMNKILATQDGGVLILGTDIVDYLAGQNEFKAFLLKLDSLGNQEWFNYYAYEYGDGHMSEAFDVEQTSDGGYVVAGQYSDWNTGSTLPRGWLFKVDDCGDLEWQGCELPDGLWDTSAPLSGPLRLYPNPASDFVRVVAPSGVGGSAGWAAFSIIDITGKEVLHSEFRVSSSENFESGTLNIESIPAGLYTLIATTKDGKVFSSKLVVE